MVAVDNDYLRRPHSTCLTYPLSRTVRGTSIRAESIFGNGKSRKSCTASDPCTERSHRTTSVEPSHSGEDTMAEQTNGTDLFEIIKTTRSMRRLKPDPVPNELIRKILEAGVCAPSGGNMQRWHFLVIRDPKVKETVGALYKRAWDEQVAPRYRSGEPAPGTSRKRFERMLAAAEYLANHIHEAPVWIVPCLEGATPTRTSGSSIYPAVQNMLLAAALGLGATLTTLYLQSRKKQRRRLAYRPMYIPIRCCRSATRWAGSALFAEFRSQMSSTKISGASLTGIRSGNLDTTKRAASTGILSKGEST